MESKHRKASRSLRTDLESLQVESKHRKAKTIDSRDIEPLDRVTVKGFSSRLQNSGSRDAQTLDSETLDLVTSTQIVAMDDSVTTLHAAHVKRVLAGTKIRPCAVYSLRRRWTRLIWDLGQWCYNNAQAAKRTTILPQDVVAAIAGEARHYAGYGHLTEPMRPVGTKEVE